MTKRGETDNFKASDFIKVLNNYLGAASHRLSYVLVNKKIKRSKNIEKWYRHYGSRYVTDDLKEENFKIIAEDFTDDSTFLRHDPEKLSQTLMNIL